MLDGVDVQTRVGGAEEGVGLVVDPGDVVRGQRRLAALQDRVEGDAHVPVQDALDAHLPRRKEGGARVGACGEAGVGLDPDCEVIGHGAQGERAGFPVGGEVGALGDDLAQKVQCLGRQQHGDEDEQVRVVHRDRSIVGGG